MMRALVLCVAGLVALPGPAVSGLKIVDAGSDYVLKLDGPIEPGLRNEILAAIRERGSFPVAFQLRSPGGDFDEAFATGRLLRDALLATTVRERCDGACFLVWSAGIRRGGRGSMDIGLSGRAPDAGRLRDYFDAMGVPVALRLAARGNESLRRTVTGLQADIGAMPASYISWLDSQCAPLDENEQQDIAALEALTVVEASLNSMGMGSGSAMYNVDTETQQRASRAREFTAERRESLRERKAELGACRMDTVAQARAAWLRGLSDG